MIRKLQILLLFQLGSFAPISGQDTLQSRYQFHRIYSHDLVVGYTYQGSDRQERYPALPIHYLEVGYARSWMTHGGPHGASGLIFSATQSWAVNRELLTATRVGLATRAGLGHLGLYLAYYTDFELGNLKFSPEVGLAGPYFKAVMGFNIPTLYNRDFEALRHAALQVSMIVNVPMVRR